MTANLFEGDAGEAKTITPERALVANSIGEALSEVARRNLAYRMTETLPDVYRMLQSNFNEAIGQIDVTLKSAADIVASVHTGVGEISKAADDLSVLTERQASTLEQTAAALHEITEAVSATAASVKPSQESIAATNRSVEEGADVVRRAVEAAKEIKALMSGSAAQVEDGVRLAEAAGSATRKNPASRRGLLFQVCGCGLRPGAGKLRGLPVEGTAVRGAGGGSFASGASRTGFTPCNSATISSPDSVS
jgi:methyl-accepting chemotaxis protein